MTPRMTTTYSMWSLFRNCRKACYWRYIRELAPIRRDPRLGFGTLIHECLELWHRNRDLAAVLAHLDQSLPNRNQDDEQRRDWRLGTAMMTGYANRYPVEEFEVLALEHTFEGEIINPANRPSGELMRRLRERCLLKEVFREPLYRCGDEVFRERMRTPEGRKELERQIANICSPDQPWLVFVDLQGGEPLRKGAWEEGPETIHIVGANRERRLYDAVSPVFRFGAHWGVDFLNVYTPLKETEPERRRHERAELRGKIAELIGLSEEVAGPTVCPHCGRSLPQRDNGCCPVCGIAVGVRIRKKIS